MGIFADWQPAYAEAGIATFPIDGEAKRPRVKEFAKGGKPASCGWAAKYGDSSAFAFMCGERNRLTVLDLDAADERLLADAFAKVGSSPVVIQTPSGGFHAYYRHNGEKSSIRKRAREWGLEGPIDILARNRLCLASPSANSKGEYRFIEGSLADLANLPIMALPGVPAAAPAQGEAVKEGERNNELFRACLIAAPECSDQEQLLRRAVILNEGRLPPDEVARTAGSAWRYQVEGRNGLAGAAYIQIATSVAEPLEANPDALYLYMLLKRRHWGRDFAIANEWRGSLPCGSMSRPRFVAARNFLLRSNLIRQVSPPSDGKAALYSFTNSPILLPQGG